MSLPDVPRRLTGFLVVPLIGQRYRSGRFDGELGGIADAYRDIGGLLRDFELCRYGEGENIGSHRIACTVFDDAAHLHSIPCGVGCRGGGGGGSAAPVAPRGLIGFFELPLVRKSQTRSSRDKCHGIAIQ